MPTNPTASTSEDRVLYFTALAREWAAADVWGIDMTHTQIAITDGDGKPSGVARYPMLRVEVTLGADDALSKAVILHELAHIAACRRFGPWHGHGDLWWNVYIGAVERLTGRSVHTGLADHGGDLCSSPNVDLTAAVAKVLES
jgi:hypothetical protein